MWRAGRERMYTVVEYIYVSNMRYPFLESSYIHT